MDIHVEKARKKIKIAINKLEEILNNLEHELVHNSFNNVDEICNTLERNMIAIWLEYARTEQK